jgi:lipopolysaccharide export system protein LptC
VSSSATPPPELHLPDLPEVPVSLRPLAPPEYRRQPLPWGQRLRNALMAYLPLLLMAALAGSTWWLVKNTPSPDGPATSGPPRQDPDYTMHRFNITRFDAQGRFALRIEGEVLRHYPATDHFEIDGVRLHAVTPDGRTTDATARRALSNADGSEVQLIGAAQVIAQVEGGDTLQIDSEFLHAFLRFERLRSHLPVLVRRGADETRAAGLDYDHLDRRLLLRGPVRSVYRPGAGPPAAERQKQSASAPALTAPAPQESTR